MEGTHVMIDLETLGTGDHAAIVQVAAVEFSVTDGLSQREFCNNVLLPCMNFGNIEGDTALWWLKQSEDARSAAFNQDDAEPLKTVLERLLDWWPLGVVGVWANSPNFDTRLLRQAFERCGLNGDRVTHFKLERCYRTVRAIGRELGVAQGGASGIMHHALDDARSQAEHCAALLLRIEDTF